MGWTYRRWRECCATTGSPDSYSSPSFGRANLASGLGFERGLVRVSWRWKSGQNAFGGRVSEGRRVHSDAVTDACLEICFVFVTMIGDEIRPKHWSRERTRSSHYRSWLYPRPARDMSFSTGRTCCCTRLSAMSNRTKSRCPVVKPEVARVASPT